VIYNSFCCEKHHTSVETYQAHVESEHHKTQERLYTEFSQEVNDWQYSELRRELKTILDECKEFDEAMIERDLDLVLTDIKNELDRNEKRIEEIRRSCDWASGLLEVQTTMVSQMKLLIDRGRQEQKKTCCRKTRTMHLRKLSKLVLQIWRERRQERE